MGNSSDRRVSRRVSLNPHMLSSLTCLSHDSVQHSASIMDMGFTGVKFKSQVPIPRGEEVVLCMSVHGVSENVMVQGSIVHSVPGVDGSFEYGMEFYLTDEETELWSEAIEVILHDTDGDAGVYPYEVCSKYI